MGGGSIQLFFKKVKFQFFFRPSNLKIEESFDTIFNMGYGSGKSPMDERVKQTLGQDYKLK